MPTARSLLTTFAFLATIQSATALNDWSKPCFGGECTYDIPDDGDTSSGSLKIWAETTDAIADITGAADWEVVGCEKDALRQDIRIVCKTGESEGCNKLFSSGTAEGKVVRLPEECGKNAFARIAKSFEPEDQSIPSHIAARLVRRDGVPPKVEALSIDTDFSAVDVKKYGKINFAIQGANVPGAKGDIPIGKPVYTKKKKAVPNRLLLGKRPLRLDHVISKLPKHLHFPRDGNAHLTARDLHVIARHPALNFSEEEIEILFKRGWFSKAFKSVKSAIKDAVKTIKEVGKDIVGGAKDLVEDIGDNVKDVVEDIGDGIADGAKVLWKGVENGLDKIGDGIQKVTKYGEEILGKLTHIELSDSIEFEPVNIDERFNILNEKRECDGAAAHVSIDVNAKAQSMVKLGVMAAGTLIPPKFEDFSVSATLTADLDSSIEFTAGLTGTFDSGKVKLFEVGIPGLSFPGILTVGPSFRVDGQAKAALDLNVDLNVGVNYKIEKAQLVFPRPKDGHDGNFVIEDTPLKLSASPSVEATGSVEAHLIPSLNLGLDAIGGAVKAQVYVNLDASAAAKLELHASAQGEVDIDVPNPSRRRHMPNRLPIRDAVAADESEKADASEAETTSASSTESTESTPSVTSTSSIDSTSTSATEESLPTEVSITSGEADANRSAVETSGSAEWGGCFNVYAGLAVNAGAEGSFFGFFDGKKNFSLFSKTFDLFKKCFGNEKRGLSASRAYYAPMSRRMEHHRRMNKLSNLALRSFDYMEKRGFSCPKEGVGAVESVIDSVNAISSR